MDYWVDEQARLRWQYEPVAGKRIDLIADEIRRERTGIHATIFISLMDSMLQSTLVLAYDTFNVTRSEERTKLANRAIKASTNTVKDAYPADALSHDLDMFCLHLTQRYEEQRFEVVTYEEGGTIPTLAFAVWPYLIHGGGTIFYAAPGAGKSLTLQTMAIEVAQGGAGLWQAVTRAPVLYVNLERSAVSLERRHRMLTAALGHASAPVTYIHARGYGLKAVETRVRRFVRDNDHSVLMLDSLSRAQTGGSLIEDTTANRFTDLMNSLGTTWAAIGHVRRGDDSHVYGSIHQDAGADIMVQVTSQKKDAVLGVQLRITKANDIGNAQPDYLAFEFNEGGVVGVRGARSSEFPELMIGEKMTRSDKVDLYLSEHDVGNAEDIAATMGLSPADVTRILRSDRYVRLRREGHKVVYGRVAG